ncbi:AraC family transcriptional regulator [Pseudanabaena sp. FACHB-2040]|uniref:helix-turn-helix domain-containing protein n=1 Tax=Pseudanabaena sp. FACHB-2040 TaxID=2692859 RepID=UPI00168407CE|nr:AraC family transcriptional regulator [Pseudanabaena sp. FACHB-2040]MBD2256037.1 helix-turn-helix transcriptional regulator [Pseudanabaena sp. FACHB-2040]
MSTQFSTSILDKASQAAPIAHHLLPVHTSEMVLTCPKGLDQLKLQKAIEYIHQHLTDEISLGSIAAHLNMSRFHFCRLFKESMGVTPYQYLLQMRIEQAKHLLLKDNSRVAEVAVETGFADQSQLSRHFKRLVGISPKQFVQQSSNPATSC